MPTFVEPNKIKTATSIGTLATSAITIGGSNSVSTTIENNLTINGTASTDNSYILSLVNSEDAAAADVMMRYVASDKGYAMGIRGSNDNFEIAYKSATDPDLDDTNILKLSTDGNLDVMGDLTINGNDRLAFENGATIVNTSAILLTITEATTEFVGAITATSDITAFSSDKRLKKDIVPIDSPLDKLYTLSGFTYKWNKDKCKEAGFEPKDEEQIGVFAQDVQAVVPQAVKPAPFDTDGNGGSKSGDNYLTVQYEKLVPLLIESIKEQQLQINSLQERIKLLEKNNE